jgi:pimeloyl-ACP methyl ester carboxylesterase
MTKMPENAVIKLVRNDFKEAAASSTSPTDNTRRAEVKVVAKKKVFAFFIGGAADKESYYFQGPNNNVQIVKDFFDPLVEDLVPRHLYEAYHLDYSDAKGSGDIKQYIQDKILEKASPVYIVGHSLGGWNGAHLSAILSDAGYSVEMLITLDPVGEGFFVSLGSDIHASKPKPVAKFWINLRAKPKKPDQSDGVAEFGERWTVTEGPQLNYICDVNHYDAKKMFLAPLKDKKSAGDYMLESIRKLTN